MRLLLQLLLCIFIPCLLLYSYLDRHNQIVFLRLEIPKLAKEVRLLEEDNRRLVYDLESLENPIHLMELSRKAEFGHLKQPYLKDILYLDPQEDPGHG